MSRTAHPRRGEVRHRRSPVSRLTRVPGATYWTDRTPLAADGNHWEGTIAHVGGDTRRKSQRDQRERKRIGRRRDRRRQEKMTNQASEE